VIEAAAKLGTVSGIYSDLLLHDMGPELADVDAYAVFVNVRPLPSLSVMSLFPLPGGNEPDLPKTAVEHRTSTGRR
jgi:hypothetical protein